MTQADAIAFLNTARDTLARQSDLSPDNPHVNTCLRGLVATLQRWQRAGFGETLADLPALAGAARDLPALCGKAECEMEKWWARRILASDCPGAQALAAFWYLDAYEALCRAELRLIGDSATGEFVFLGSGALPVTAILLAGSAPRGRVICIDCDGEACELAARLVALLGLSERVTMIAAEAQSYCPAPDATVICASLLQAPSLFEHLRERRTRRLIVRDAEGAYRFCYRQARLPGGYYAERAKSRPSPERINTSRYFELCDFGSAARGQSGTDR
jgi:hypothetical protein